MIMKLIEKDALVTELKRRYSLYEEKYHHSDTIDMNYYGAKMGEDTSLLCFLDTLEVKDPYEQYVQYYSIKAGIQAHAETYSFNIESELFQQLTKEQQKLWRKEIEQAVISGGEMGVELARPDITSWCYLNDLHNFTQKEEPAIEDLGDYINELSKQFPDVSFAKLSRIAVRVAKWQKERDEADRAAVYKCGWNDRKAMMMAKAIDGKVIANGMGNPILHLWDKGKHLIDKKVKVVVIKED